MGGTERGKGWRGTTVIVLVGMAAAALGVVLLSRSDTQTSVGGGILASLGSEMKEAPAGAEPTEDLFVEARYDRWQTFHRKDGLPSEKVLCIRVDGETVWAGTDNGLARYHDGRWTTFSVEDGLPHRAVLSLDVSPQTGDLWIGTAGGLARYSTGRFDVFTQNTSGLPNDFVNDVDCDPEEPHVWAATAMGVSRLDLLTRSWTVFTHENTPMHEPWTYSTSIDRGRVYVGVWGAGVLEYDKAADRWREYRDPDKEMEVDVLPGDGPVHDVTAGVDYRGGRLWQATYVGLARYDGRRWGSYFNEDSGLISNFINFVRARGRTAWLCTDKGLSVTDGDKWVSYRRNPEGRGEALFYKGKKLVRRSGSAAIFGHNFLMGADLRGAEVWLATDGGVSRGWRSTASGGAAGFPAFVPPDDSRSEDRTANHGRG